MSLLLTPEDIKRLLRGSLSLLRLHQEELNKLNVYPVPDGDTGTNMVLTLQSVWEALSSVKTLTMASLAEALSYGSLTGARGNSGVILSQIIRGICEVIKKEEAISSKNIIEALKQGAEVAYQAVRKPVEGTMLTVIRDMAAKASEFLEKDVQIEVLLEAILEEGRRSVERTPELLDVLREAGVVDAGGLGLVVILEGALRALRGEKIEEEKVERIEVSVKSAEEVLLEYTYCTEFLLQGENLDGEFLEKELSSLGNSLMVVGSEKLKRVHIHTNSPGKVLEIATPLGSLSQIKINNMVEQAKERSLTLKKESKRTGVVAVALGEGIKAILLSLGVDKVILGGESSNPSTAEIAEAVESVSAGEVIILPNHKNVILAAERVEEISNKKVFILPTKSIPEAFAALLVYDSNKSASSNYKEMKKAIKRVKSAEVTVAVRDSTIEGKKIKKGDFIGLFNHKIAVNGKNLIEVVDKLLSEMIEEEDEVLTLITGEDAKGEEGEKLLEFVKKKYPHLEVELYEGKQPLYPLIIGVE